jgi:RNA polymerase sigma-70 factor (sigma-E family)
VASRQAPEQQVPQARPGSRNGRGPLNIVGVQPGALTTPGQRQAPPRSEGTGAAKLVELPESAGLAGPAELAESAEVAESVEVADATDVAGLVGAGRDELTFREYVSTRSRALLRTAYLLTGNLADAEDLVQAALAKTYLAWDRIEDRGAIDGYVRRAIVNTHISWWRRRRVEEYPTDEIPDQAIADHAGNSDLQESMRRAVDRLPQRMRAAVMLRYYEDMTEAEVAEALGVSLGTVKSTVSRAMAKLRDDADLQL